LELNQYTLEDESWNMKVHTAAHEQGHGFGLGEGNVSGTLMYQWSPETVTQPQSDDIAGIEYIY